ncbi:hypothetical protein LRR18_05465 [Mangrovimonas sp. AS39]|uniref:hypothetical protein n=1 Tax=Mangrovimonas futianensis TaxID=2895523 RepID=UPI001E58BF2E|nr:hypothetical protein [Mangrovimonas futianensis]MCF1191026.1 hypothetical protein [Mangrovimonas futianensis]MCF1194721.1 hypothetical protein [Mangrovimonas futianensis]
MIILLILTIVGFLILDIFLFAKLFRLFFKEKDSFNESVWYSFKPDLLSFFDGEFWRDKASETKLKLFLFLCFVIMAGEFIILKQIGLLPN